MKKSTTHSLRAIKNIRARLRQDLERLALTHRGCLRARGCGCAVDRALSQIATCERELFSIELDSYADPMSPRRLVESDNSVHIVTGRETNAAGELTEDPRGFGIGRPTEPTS